MELSAEQRIAAPREAVWSALNDPDVLRQCIPGCEMLEMQGPNEMHAIIVIRFGPVKANFKGKVTLEDVKAPLSYRIVGEGTGGVAGFAKGGAQVWLEIDTENSTILHYNATAQIGGKLAQLGSRLVEATSKKLAASFFEKFAAIVAADRN